MTGLPGAVSGLPGATTGPAGTRARCRVVRHGPSYPRQYLRQYLRHLPHPSYPPHLPPLRYLITADETRNAL